MTELVKLSPKAIRTDGGTQHRLVLDQVAIEDYAASMKDGSWDWDRSPLLVTYDGKNYWLVGGFHRQAAAIKSEVTEVLCDVRPGTQRDAVLLSVSENTDHGVRLTRAARRNKVISLLSDQEWKLWNDSEIGRRCDVDHKTVKRIRAELYPGNSQDSSKVQRGDSTYEQHKPTNSKPGRVGGFDPDADPNAPAQPVASESGILQRTLQFLEALYALHGDTAWVRLNQFEVSLRGGVGIHEDMGTILRRKIMEHGYEVNEVQITEKGCTLIGKPLPEFPTRTDDKPQTKQEAFKQQFRDVGLDCMSVVAHRNGHTGTFSAVISTAKIGDEAWAEAATIAQQFTDLGFKVFQSGVDVGPGYQTAGWNGQPAIFVHFADPDYKPTQTEPTAPKAASKPAEKELGLLSIPSAPEMIKALLLEFMSKPNMYTVDVTEHGFKAGCLNNGVEIEVRTGLTLAEKAAQRHAEKDLV